MKYSITSNRHNFVSTSIHLVPILLILVICVLGCTEAPREVSLERKLKNGVITLALPPRVYSIAPNKHNHNDDPFILYQMYEGVIQKIGNTFHNGAPTERFQYYAENNRLVIHLKKDYTFSNGWKIDSTSLNHWLQHVESIGIDIKYRAFGNLLEINTSNEKETLEKISSASSLLFTIKENKSFGGGPFYLDRIWVDGMAILKKNPSYYQNDAVFLDQINIKLIDTLEDIQNGLALGNIDIGVLDHVGSYHFGLTSTAEIRKSFESKLLGDSLITKLTYATEDSLWISVLMDTMNMDVQDSVDYEYMNAIDSLQFDSIPLIKYDSNLFSMQTASLFSNKFSQYQVDTSRFINITTLPVNENDHIILSNQGQSEVVINYWTGKIVYQYYIKNIEYINDRIIDLKRVYLEKAVLLNP